ncbi:MAG: hypothetical protein V6Z89_04420 [Desulfobacter sp.]
MKKFIVAVAASAMLFTGSAIAADWNFYGSARVSTFVTEADQSGTETDNFAQELQGNARIGATVKVSDELAGGFEYGASSGNANIRKLYGEWDFGAGTFLVGQTYTPLNWFYSNQVFGTDNDLLAQGGVYSGRQAMLRLKFGGFQIAAVSPDSNTSRVSGASGSATTEVNFPAIEAKYTAKFDKLTVQVAGGYNSYEINDSGNNYDVDSYVVALGGKLDLGPAFINANIYFGQNAGNLMAVSVDGDNDWDDGYAAISGTDLIDNDAMGFLLVGGYTFNDMFTVEAGYGYAETELDNNTTEDEVASYYINATITMAPGVFVVPEIGVIDGEEDGDTDTTYYGAKWQINF